MTQLRTKGILHDSTPVIRNKCRTTKMWYRLSQAGSAHNGQEERWGESGRREGHLRPVPSIHQRAGRRDAGCQGEHPHTQKILVNTSQSPDQIGGARLRP